MGWGNELSNFGEGSVSKIETTGPADISLHVRLVNRMIRDQGIVPEVLRRNPIRKMRFGICWLPS